LDLFDFVDQCDPGGETKVLTVDSQVTSSYPVFLSAMIDNAGNLNMKTGL
jgi:hypothetical protein